MELKVIINPIDGNGPAKRLLSNLFYGCGYNFYRCRRQLHADDLLIRAKLSQLLRECRVHLSSLEAAFLHKRRVLAESVYAFSDPQALLTAEALERAQRDLEAMERAVRARGVRSTDRAHRANRQEHGMDTLDMLVASDGEVLLALVTLRDAVAKLKDGAAAAATMGNLLRASDFSALWRRREALLLRGTLRASRRGRAAPCVTGSA
jgi:hypothetical protein